MQPLTGIRVIEFASLMSGPYAGLMLAELGAEVMKVESPAGDLTRCLPPIRAGVSSSFYNLNRGKRSVAVDLRTPEGQDVAHRLVGTADVTIENWRPGVAERLGLGSSALRARHPGLITVSVRGFGEAGPYARDRVYDSIIQAVAAITTTQGTADQPQFIRTYLPDKLAALAAAQGVLAALVQRSRTGTGTQVSVSMLDAAIAFQWPDVMRGLTFPGSTDPAATRHAPRIGSLSRSADDRWLSVEAVSDAEWAALCGVIGRPDLIASHPDVPSRKSDSEFLGAQIQRYMRTHTRDEVLAALRAADVPSGPINTPDELLNDPQVLANEAVCVVERPVLGHVREAGPIVRVGERRGPSELAAPALGEHTDVVLGGLGYTPEDLEHLRHDRIITSAEGEEVAG